MTTNKKLEDKAIDIKGKKYVLVSDRILAFNEMYPKGQIQTEIIGDVGKMVIVKATVKPDESRVFTGHSQAVWGEGMMGRVALEVAETSSVGRALAMMGLGVIDSVASVDEIAKNQPVDKSVESEDKTIKTEMYSQEKIVGGKKWIRREGVKDGKKWVLWTDGEKRLWGDKSFIDYSAQVVDSDL